VPTKVRIISKKDSSWDHFIAELVEQEGFGSERTYFGIATRERAAEVRSKLVSAGRHHEVSVKAFWKECQGCPDGGSECRFHVFFSAYDPEVARAYKERLSQIAQTRAR